jgi:tetratricopeptide (TPR) repeat protein
MPRTSTCLLVLAFIVAATPALAQTERLLEPGKPVQHELAGGEVHTYQLHLTAGQYAQVTADQRRINIALSAYDPAGKKIAETDLFKMGESELLSLVSEASGKYRIDVRAPDKSTPRGSYEIRIAGLHPATEKDRFEVAAESLVAEAKTLDSQATTETWRKAIEKYQQSIPLWKSAKNPVGEATVLYLIADACINLGESQKAFDYSNQALQLAQAAARTADAQNRNRSIQVHAYALGSLGQAHNEFGDKKKALELLNQALVLHESIGDRVGEAITLNNIAASYQFLDNYPKAFDFLNRAQPIVNEIGDRAEEAGLLNNMCVILVDMGEYRKALDACSRSLSLREDLHDSANAAPAHNNLGSIYSNLGEYQKALDSYRQALASNKASGSLQGQAIALNNIAWVYSTLGEYQKAIDVYQQALEMFRSVGDPYREANVLSNIASTYAELKDFRKALEINLQVLPLRQSTHNPSGEAVTLNNIAGNYSNLGEKGKALD